MQHRHVEIGVQLDPFERDQLYAERAQAALEAINQPNYPAGMIAWLESEQPELYRMLTSILPDRIHDLWSRHASFFEFDAVLARLVETHRRACELYRAEAPKSTKQDFGTLRGDGISEVNRKPKGTRAERKAPEIELFP